MWKEKTALEEMTKEQCQQEVRTAKQQIVGLDKDAPWFIGRRTRLDDINDECSISALGHDLALLHSWHRV
jgi:hypothetical protein